MDPTDSQAGEQLKASALQKLKQAVELLDSARQDMANLEGVGYCEKYEKLASVRGSLTGLACSFQNLKPPTGVFHI